MIQDTDCMKTFIYEQFTFSVRIKRTQSARKQTT